jgi:hypothetical protein
MPHLTAQFSIMQHNQEWLVVKTGIAGTPLVVAACYLEHYAKTICDLLQTEENAKYES